MAKERVTFSEAELKRQQEEIEWVKKKLRSTDFGKLRQDVVRRAESLYPVIETAAVEAVTENPVIIANIIGILPPLVNKLLKLTSTILSRTEFPSEILASATFNLLSDIEIEELGRCINELSRLIAGIHEGSLILDKDEPRFRKVAENLLERLTTPLNPETLDRAIVALCDNLEILGQVSIDVITERPELLQRCFSFLLLVLNASVAVFNHALEKVGTLPPPLVERLAGELREKVDYRELGELANSLLNITDRLLQKKPVLLEKSLNAFFDSVDKELLKKVVAEAVVKSSSQIASVLANNPLLGRALVRSGILVLRGAIKGYFRSFFARK